MNAIYLPVYKKEKPLYIGFFNVGAYQETIGGYGGLQHCLIPAPKHILIDKDADGKISTQLFREQQKSEELLEILGYEQQPETNTTQNLNRNLEFQLVDK
jgi:arginine decarboxylase